MSVSLTAHPVLTGRHIPGLSMRLIGHACEKVKILENISKYFHFFATVVQKVPSNTDRMRKCLEIDQVQPMLIICSSYAPESHCEPQISKF